MGRQSRRGTVAELVAAADSVVVECELQRNVGEGEDQDHYFELMQETVARLRAALEAFHRTYPATDTMGSG